MQIIYKGRHVISIKTRRKDDDQQRVRVEGPEDDKSAKFFKIKHIPIKTDGPQFWIGNGHSKHSNMNDLIDYYKRVKGRGIE